MDWKKLGQVWHSFHLTFVIVADVLTLLNLPRIPGISKLAAAAEIGYSVFVLLCFRKMK
jgi:hypothetical protein